MFLPVPDGREEISSRKSVQNTKFKRFLPGNLLNLPKGKAREKLTSQLGIEHRGKRCIEPEAVFGQMKYNMAYRRFRHTGKDKVTMDFTFFAIAFNLKKLCAKLGKEAKKALYTAF
jgi:hypothetical protein